MQQREQDMLEKLAEAHEAQSKAMQRFAQARARSEKIPPLAFFDARKILG